MSRLSMDSAPDVISEPGTDLRRAMFDYERSKFTPGDEQTVNAALVSLIIAFSWLLGHTGRVHHDRARFSIPKDGGTFLYSACVDGLILHLENNKCNAFMEVKRDFRQDNQSVRRQIAAQMAAFIFDQDVVPAEKETERENEMAPKGKGKGKEKGKGKKANAKIANAKIKKDEIFRKWMISLDGYFAYINIATYDQQYVKFLSGHEPSNPDDAFMLMTEYGPFDLRTWTRGLESFLKYVGALMVSPVDT